MSQNNGLSTLKTEKKEKKSNRNIKKTKTIKIRAEIVEIKQKKIHEITSWFFREKSISQTDL